MDAGCFYTTGYANRLETDDADGPAYAVQYYVLSKALYNRYVNLYAFTQSRAAADKWGSGFVAFGTLMEVIERVKIQPA